MNQQMGHCVQVAAKIGNIAELVLDLRPMARPEAAEAQAVVRVASAAVNPSDAKATLGLMPHTVWPRIPGRDYAGVVEEGPAAWIGKEVWGSGGDLGMSCNGSHASWIQVPVSALREKPRALSMDEAGSIGVPFVTALDGFLRSGMPRAGQTVLVLGANGKVGQAAVQLAAQEGATVIAVQRSAGPLPGWTPEGVHVIQAEGMVEQVKAITGGHGADIVYNTVGSPYFQNANACMAKGATQIFIATQDRAVPFDIFTFYRGMHTYVGIDSLAMNCTDSAGHLQLLHAGFERCSLRPYPVEESAVFGLENAAQAYRQVLSGDSRRLVIRP